MKKSYPVEFVYQALSLIIAVIVVHAVYVLVVRPKAEIALGEQRAMIELDPANAQERSVWIIIRSTMFFSSRTFPGHSYSSKMARAPCSGSFGLRPCT